MAARRPAGFAPSTAPKSAIGKGPATMAEEEEFEKFLADVAEGELRLKKREDEERQRDWEETQQYLKKQRDVRLAVQPSQPNSISELPPPTHLPPPPTNPDDSRSLALPLVGGVHPDAIPSPATASGPAWSAQPKSRTSPRGEHASPAAAATSPAHSPRAPVPQPAAGLAVPAATRLGLAGPRSASPLLSAARQRPDGGLASGAPPAVPPQISPRLGAGPRLAPLPSPAPPGPLSPGRTRADPRPPPPPLASTPAPSLSPRNPSPLSASSQYLSTAHSALAAAAEPSAFPPLSSYDVARVVRVQALVRRFLCMTAYHRKRIGREKHRLNVARELLETERQYVRALEAAVQSYYDRLMFNCKVCSSSASTEKPILDLEKLQTIFCNLPEIRNFNANFLTELTARCEHFDSNTKIGDVFLKWGPFFKIYITYCNNHERAAHLFLELREEPRFGAWLENTRTLMQIDPLDSYLIRPVQRIPRYLLLLNDLLKATKPDHCDYTDLKSGIAQMQTLADNINSAIKQAEKLNQVLQIQEKLGMKDLVEPSRVFVRTGVLQLCHLDNSSMFKKDVANYWFYLFNDLLVWAERTGDSYRFRGRVSLVGMRLKDISDITVLQNAFHLISPDRTLTISAPTKKEKAVWMEQIQDCITRLKDLQKRIGGDAPTVPFISATIICNETRKDKEGKSFTIYVIEIKRSTGNVEWIERRYSEFDTLHSQIDKRFPNQNFTKLPKKHLLGNLKKDIVQSRQIMLENYLQELIAKPDVCRCEELERFLTANAEKKSTLPVKVFYKQDADISWTVAVSGGTRSTDIMRHVGKKLGCDTSCLTLLEVWNGGERRLDPEESVQMLKNKWELQNLQHKLYIARSDHSPNPSRQPELDHSSSSLTSSTLNSSSLSNSSSSLTSSSSALPIEPLGVPVPRDNQVRAESPSVFDNFQNRPLPMSPLRGHVLDDRPRTPSSAQKPLPPLPARAGSKVGLTSSESSPSSEQPQPQPPQPPPPTDQGSLIQPAPARLAHGAIPTAGTRPMSPPSVRPVSPLHPPATAAKISPRPVAGPVLKKPANVREW